MLPVEWTNELIKKAQIYAQDWLKKVADILSEMEGIESTEQAFSKLTKAAVDFIGDANAADRQGALKEGEFDYRVSGIFLISPDRIYNVLVANQGFPPEQRRLSIPITWNNPGQVVADERLILLENTDEHREFRQFLKTSKMGSSLYVPIFSEGKMIGQIVAASQARWTYSRADLAPMIALSGLAALAWGMTRGDAWWSTDYPAADAWYAEEQRL